MQATQAWRWRLPAGAVGLPTKHRWSKMLTAERTGPRRWGNTRNALRGRIAWIPVSSAHGATKPSPSEDAQGSLGARPPRHLEGWNPSGPFGGGLAVR